MPQIKVLPETQQGAVFWQRSAKISNFSTASFSVAQNTTQATINSAVTWTRNHLPCSGVGGLQSMITCTATQGMEPKTSSADGLVKAGIESRWAEAMLMEALPQIPFPACDLQHHVIQSTLCGLNPYSPVSCLAGSLRLNFRRAWCLHHSGFSLGLMMLSSPEPVFTWYESLIAPCLGALSDKWLIIPTHLCKAQNYRWQKQSIIRGEQSLTT